MKTQISKPACERARYTEQYKQEALELWRASGRSAAKVAAELGIRAPLLYRWARLECLPGQTVNRGARRQAKRLPCNQEWNELERTAASEADQ